MIKDNSFKSIASKIVSHRFFLPLVSLALVLIFNIIKTPNFFNITVKNGVLYGYVIDILNRSSELIILAAGMTLVVASSGGTDISVGATSAVAGAVCIYALGSGYSYNIPYGLGFILALLVGAICGSWNGFLVAKLKIQPMVATLILYTAGRGIAQLITDGQNLYVKVESYKYLGGFIPGVPIPTPIIVAILLIIVVSLILKKTVLGLYVRSVGTNPVASRVVGLNSNLIIFVCYAFCGLCAGLAGMIITSRVHSIDANNAGINLELDAILAVALGGNSLAGGQVSLVGSTIGAITIQTLTTSLYALKVTADQLPIYKAIVVIIIVSLQSPELKKLIKSLASGHAKKGQVV